MRISGLVFLAALLGAMPAVAQTACRITNAADGKQSLVSGEVTDTSLAMLMTENGPFPGKLTLDADSAYRQAPGGAATIKVFRAGNSVPGKDWREPGSVETVDGGLLMTWPEFSLRGAVVRNLSVELASGYTKTRQTLTYPATHKGSPAIFLRLDGRVATPSNAELIETNYSELQQWRTVILNRPSFRVDVFDENAGVHIATIDFAIPDSETTQARLISDVTALRRAAAEMKCE